MNTALWTGLVASALYLMAFLLAVRQLRSTQTPQRLGFLGLGTLALLFHACALWHLIVQTQGIRLGLLPMASLVGATGTATLIASSLYRRLEWVSLMVFPYNLVALPLALFIDTGYQPHTLSYGLGSHVLLATIAFAILALAACHSILVLLQHHQLKHGHIRGIMRAFPPIQAMEAMLFELIWVGVVLLVCAIIAGFIFVDDLFAQGIAHKTILTLLSTALFIGLLIGRHVLGWRGVTAVRLTVTAFILLLLAFFGSQLVLEVILRRYAMPQ